MIEVNGINIGEKFNSFSEYWTPKIVGELNGQFVKLAKLKGEFVWHNHKEEDECKRQEHRVQPWARCPSPR